MTLPVVPVRTGEGFTVGDWLRLPDDGLRYELVDGSLHRTPPPTPRHQRLTNRIVEVLRRTVSAEFTVDNTGAGIATADMGAHRALIPDVVVTGARAAGAEESTLNPVDVVLVVEVVSPSSWRRDHNDKRDIFAAWGIPHYWIVDQAPEPRLTALRIQGDRYVEDATGGTVDTVQLAQPFPVRLALAQLFDR